jgi:hypothetical protein
VLAGSARANSAEAAALQVQVYDYAGLEPHTLRQFLSWTERILVSTGMSVQLSLCRGSLAVSCENQTGRLDSLVVRIVAGEAKTTKNVNRPALGQSFAGKSGGTHATVFVHPVKDQAAAGCHALYGEARSGRFADSQVIARFQSAGPVDHNANRGVHAKFQFAP